MEKQTQTAAAANGKASAGASDRSVPAPAASSGKPEAVSSGKASAGASGKSASAPAADGGKLESASSGKASAGASGKSVPTPAADGKKPEADAVQGASVAVSQPCGAACGSLPGVCAPLAFPYIPVQDSNPVRYDRREALETGTLFPGLNLPFVAAIQARTRLTDTARVELMALDFAIQELGLYLTTHPQDQEVLQLYWSYILLSQEGRARYQEQYGPLLQTDLTPEDGFAWLNDPWPWDVGGND